MCGCNVVVVVSESTRYPMECTAHKHRSATEIRLPLLNASDA